MVKGKIDKKCWKSKRVFITGATGFVGSNLAEKLVSLDAEVTIIDRDIKNNNPLQLFGVNEKVHQVFGDVTDYYLMNRIISEYQIEVVFHLAAQPGISAST